MIPIILAGFILSAGQATAAAHSHVTEAFERAARSVPEQDEKLNRAARTLAQKALGSATLEEVTTNGCPIEALSDAGASDAGYRLILVRASSPTEAIRAFRQREDLADEPASHYGLAVVSSNDVSILMAIVSSRKAILKGAQPFWHLPQEQVTLCINLRGDFYSPVLHITRPHGKVESFFFGSRVFEGQDGLCARIPFIEKGIHTLEVMARGQTGPEVVALYRTVVGEKLFSGANGASLSSSALADAPRLILKEINQLRKSHKVTEVQSDAALDAVATAYAAKMVEEGFFGHIAPDGSDVFQRLHLAQYRHKAAAENLGLANTPMAAHRAVMESPAHRRELVNAIYSKAGIGIARRQKKGLTEVIVVELLAEPQ